MTRASASKGAACTTARRRAVAASTRVAAPSYLADGAGRGGTGGAAAQGLQTTAVGGGRRLASPDVDMRLRLAVSGGFRACCGEAGGVAAGALVAGILRLKRKLLDVYLPRRRGWRLCALFFGAC